MLLSIGMMVKNEEKHLDDCLNSLLPILKGLDSELVIVDTGSTDKTVEIAKKYTDKIYFHKWNNNFSEMRNITLSYCSGEWFFYIDGDEVLDDSNGIIDFFNSDDYKEYKSATIYIKNLIDLNNENKFSVFSALRLFYKDQNFKFVNAVHNQPLFKKPIKYLNVNCKHYGYINNDKELMERKFKRTSTILKNELRKYPDNIYYRCQLSVTYGMYNDNENSLKEAKKAFDCFLEKNLNPKMYLYLYYQLTVCYINNKRCEAAEKICEMGIKVEEDYVDLYFYLGLIKMTLGKYKESICAYEKYLNLIENYNKLSIKNNVSVINYTIGFKDRAYANLAVIYKKSKKYDEALEYFFKIRDREINAYKDIIDIFIETEMYDEILKYVDNLISQSENNQLKQIYAYIEWCKSKLDEDESKSLTELFSNSSTYYGRLNNIRMKYIYKDTSLLEDSEKLLSVINSEDLKDYYGDLLYYMLEYKRDISKFVINAPYNIINNLIQYISGKYDAIWSTVYNYIVIYGNDDNFASLKINKELCRYSLLLGKDKIDYDKFENIFVKYVKIGINYINNVYTDFMLENERYQEMRTQEEGFFMFLRKARQFKSKDEKVYIQYIRKALKIYPCMKDGINLILDKVKSKNDTENNEFERYKKQVKTTIKSLIENDRLEDAGKIIREYEDIVKDDLEIVYLKSELSLKKLKNTNINTSYKM